MFLTPLALAGFAGFAGAASVDLSGRAAADPCAKIGNQTWVAPADVRACFNAQPLNQTEKMNILDVATKTLAFHTSVSYQAQAPAPFTLDVHEDILGDLEKYRRETQANDYDLHVKVSRAFKRLNDGHVAYINYCYDSTFVNYLPLPLTLLTGPYGVQNVHIAPEAFTVATAEFGDQIQFWQDALPGKLKSKLESLSGAKVLLINGRNPWDAVNDNAAIAGSYQGFGTRQNLFFSTYARGSSGWTYAMGQFAQQALPLSDSVTLTLQLVNQTIPTTVTIPYRSRISSATSAFTDSASFRAGNCRATSTTNGASYYDAARAKQVETADPNARARQAPVAGGAREERKHFMNVMWADEPLTNVVLPSELTPNLALPASTGVAQFYLLADNSTGVLVLGSFSGIPYEQFHNVLLDGLKDLKARGASKLIVDVSSNGGGYVCVAHFLHRIIAGPKTSTVPQAGLDTKARAGPLARAITAAIAKGADPDLNMLYNSANWRFDNDTQMPSNYDWLNPLVEVTINGRKDAFSQRLGDECQPFIIEPPAEALFDTKKVVIVGNSRCGSSCALFSITMNKEEGVPFIVVGGNKRVKQQYCGLVGGQSTSFPTIDSEIKTVGLKNHSFAPPDFLTNSVQGITWRLGFGIQNTAEPEEWQDHPATHNLELSKETVNNPRAIWEAVAKKHL